MKFILETWNYLFYEILNKQIIKILLKLFAVRIFFTPTATLSRYINRFICLIQRSVDTLDGRSYFRSMYNIKITAKEM